MTLFRKFLLSALLLCLAGALSGCGSNPAGRASDPWTQTTAQPSATGTPNQIDSREQWLSGAPAAPAVTVNAVDSALPGQPAAPAPAGAPVKVALLVPLSGSHASVGEAIANAAQLALFDVGSTTFELMPRDTKGTASGAYSAAETAIAEGAQLILGPLLAEEVRAVSPLAASRNINVIAFTTDWQQAGGSTFVMGFVPFGQVHRVLSHAAANGIRKIGVIAPYGEYGDAVMNAYNAYGAQLGLQTVDTLRFRSGDNALTQSIQKFSRFDARKLPDGRFAPAPFDAVFLPVGGRDVHTVSNLLSYFEMEPGAVRRLGTGLWDDAAIARDANLNGGWFAAPDPKSYAGFDTKYRAAYGTTPPRLASLGYDATALAAVLARGGVNGFSRAAITNANGFAGIDGIFRFRADGLAERGLAILEIRGGQSVVVAPPPRSFQGGSTQ